VFAVSGEEYTTGFDINVAHHGMYAMIWISTCLVELTHYAVFEVLD
jgi:hypothetical protein